MNFADIFVVLLILFFALLGFFKGLIYSVFKLASFFVAVGLALTFYPIVSDVLMETSLAKSIQNGITNKLLIVQDEQVKETGGSLTEETLIKGIDLPDGVINLALNKTALIDTASVVNSLSIALTEIIINIISVILLFILLRILLFIARIILQSIVKLPLIKQFDKIGGLAFGTIEGFLMIFIIFSVIMFFHSTGNFEGVFKVIDGSLVAKYFYYNNVLIWILFG